MELSIFPLELFLEIAKASDYATFWGIASSSKSLYEYFSVYYNQCHGDALKIIGLTLYTNHCQLFGGAVRDYFTGDKIRNYDFIYAPGQAFEYVVSTLIHSTESDIFYHDCEYSYQRNSKIVPIKYIRGPILIKIKIFEQQFIHNNIDFYINRLVVDTKDKFNKFLQKTLTYKDVNVIPYGRDKMGHKGTVIDCLSNRKIRLHCPIKQFFDINDFFSIDCLKETQTRIISLTKMLNRGYIFGMIESIHPFYIVNINNLSICTNCKYSFQKNDIVYNNSPHFICHKCLVGTVKFILPEDHYSRRSQKKRYNGGPKRGIVCSKKENYPYIDQ